MDRDYWKNRGKKETPSNKVSPEVARKIASMQEQIDIQLKKNPNHIERIAKRTTGQSESNSFQEKTYNPKEFRSSNSNQRGNQFGNARSTSSSAISKLVSKLNNRYLYFVLVVVMIASSFIVERGLTFESVKNKIKETNLQNLGVEYPSQNQEVKNKIKETNLQNLGVEYPSQNKDIQNKTKQTCLEKYGCEYGLQSEDIKNKTKQTCLEKYGHEHPFQNSDIMEKNIKSSYTKKEYVFPSGKIDKIQGYENFALDELIINEKINESDIITGCKNVPELWYNDKTNKKRRHYVDIFIPSQNRCIEVKSMWTYTKQIDIVLLKQKAAKALGYKYEIWIYNDKKEKINCYD